MDYAVNQSELGSRLDDPVAKAIPTAAAVRKNWREADVREEADGRCDSWVYSMKDGQLCVDFGEGVQRLVVVHHNIELDYTTRLLWGTLRTTITNPVMTISYMLRCRGMADLSCISLPSCCVASRSTSCSNCRCSPLGRSAIGHCANARGWCQSSIFNVLGLSCLENATERMARRSL